MTRRSISANLGWCFANITCFSVVGSFSVSWSWGGQDLWVTHCKRDFACCGWTVFTYQPSAQSSQCSFFPWCSVLFSSAPGFCGSVAFQGLPTCSCFHACHVLVHPSPPLPSPRVSLSNSNPLGRKTHYKWMGCFELHPFTFQHLIAGCVTCSAVFFLPSPCKCSSRHRFGSTQSDSGLLGTKLTSFSSLLVSY